MELLSPAGSREALTAAVQNGADAVYLAAAALMHDVLQTILEVTGLFPPSITVTNAECVLILH